MNIYTHTETHAKWGKSAKIATRITVKILIEISCKQSHKQTDRQTVPLPDTVDTRGVCVMRQQCDPKRKQKSQHIIQQI